MPILFLRKKKLILTINYVESRNYSIKVLPESILCVKSSQKKTQASRLSIIDFKD